MRKHGIIALGILSLAVSGCSSMFGSQKKMALYQAEIDRVSAERSIMERELREERQRRDRAEAIVMADRERSLEQARTQPETDLKKPAPAGKPAAAKPSSTKEVQRALANAGYNPGPVDGKMGQKTRTALLAFQKESGLKADGKVGHKTWGELGKHLEEK